MSHVTSTSNVTHRTPIGPSHAFRSARVASRHVIVAPRRPSVWERAPPLVQGPRQTDAFVHSSSASWKLAAHDRARPRTMRSQTQARRRSSSEVHVLRTLPVHARARGRGDGDHLTPRVGAPVRLRESAHDARLLWHPSAQRLDNASSLCA